MRRRSERPIVGNTRAPGRVNLTHVPSVHKGVPGFALHMEAVVGVRRQTVRRRHATKTFVPDMEVESDVIYQSVGKWQWDGPLFVLVMVVDADAKRPTVPKVLNPIPISASDTEVVENVPPKDVPKPPEVAQNSACPTDPLLTLKTNRKKIIDYL
eukprot:scaffold32628_cov54-Attheya_sp.AAC.3